MGLKRAGCIIGALTFNLAGASAEAATGTIRDVQHVVIFMQENRSFDHYYGTLRGVRGFGDDNALILANGNNVLYQPYGADYVLPFHTNSQCVAEFATSWPECHISWNGGQWNGWILAAGGHGMAYYDRTDLPFYYALADTFTICDSYFSSVLGPTTPNRLYLMTGIIDAAGTRGGPIVSNYIPAGGLTWTTYPERLQAAGITWKVYQQASDFIGLNSLSLFAQFRDATPGNPLYDRGLVLANDLVGAIQADVTNGTLPQVCWIMPLWSGSEHPSFAPSSGEHLTSQIIQALAANPSVWNSTVLFLNYDESGGFFDHVPPPTPPPGTPEEFIDGLPIGLGIRVPMVVVSPWTRGGYTCSQVFDHTSVIRFLERWTGVMEPNISAWRRNVCGDLTSAFDFANPVTNSPARPSVVLHTCTNGIYPLYPVYNQTLPRQETGTKPARPLPYQPNAVSVANSVTGQLSIVMTNSGTVPVPLAIYANAYRTDGPWQYVVLPGSSSVGHFDLFTNGTGLYDFTCYGPNGFNRRYAGNITPNGGLVEVTSSIDPAAGGLLLTIQNATTSAVTVTVTNALQAGSQCVYVLSPGGTASDRLGAFIYNGWYDITARASSDATFLRRFAGHIELPVLKLIASCSDTNIILTYPGSVTNRLESTATLVPPAWTAVSAAPVLVGSNAVVTVPRSVAPMYFRLQP